MIVNNIILRASSLMQRLWNLVKIKLGGSKGTIFVFHEIDTINRNRVEPSSFCTIDKFKQLLENKRGKFCSLDNLIFSASHEGYVITFDDVPESVFLNAYPLLCENKVPFVIYLSPKFIGREGFLSVEQIKELANNPLCTIGAHTMNHTKLRLECNSFEDMYDSKLAIEKIIGRKVNHLAYPYGRADSISRKVRKEAEKAGYKTATCTIPTQVPNTFDRWYIPRVAVW